MSKRKCAKKAAASLSKIATFERMSEKKLGINKQKAPNCALVRSRKSLPKSRGQILKELWKEEHSTPPKRQKTDLGSAFKRTAKLTQQKPLSGKNST